MELSEYEVTFRRDPMFGFWSWTAKAPTGDTLKGPLLGLCSMKPSAERDAVRRITMHLEAETVDGQALVDRVAEGAAA